MVDRLWAPWRSQYLGKPAPEGCIFCGKGAATAQGQDEENLVLARSEKAFALLNLYPYSNGHLMVAPYRHLNQVEDLEPDEVADLYRLVAAGIGALKRTVNPHGFNVGLNLGQVAGAGVPGHLHVHVVPRWSGDVNFMTVFGETRVISEALAQSYQELKAAWAAT